MTMIKLFDAESGAEIYVNPAMIGLLTAHGEGATSRLRLLDGSEVVVKGDTSGILKQMRNDQMRFR